MKKVIFISLIILIVIALVSGFYFFNKNVSECNIEEIRSIPVSLELAKAVASDQVHRNYPEFNWSYIGNYLAYSSLGEANYYIIIFRKSDFTSLNTLDKLEQNAKLYSDSTQEESENKYQFNDVANVYTGAMKEDKLIIRHSRGIPESIGKRLEIKEFVESKYSAKTIGNLIYDSPMDVGYYEIIYKNSKKTSGDLISVYNSSIISLSSLVQNQKRIQERKQERYSKYSKDECELYKNAVIESRNANIAQWNEFE